MPYSMRSDTSGQSAPLVTRLPTRVNRSEDELNGVGDNPIFVPELKLTLTGANFQGTPVAFADGNGRCSYYNVSVLYLSDALTV